jgi:CheY-like chemotaxis protein
VRTQTTTRASRCPPVARAPTIAEGTLRAAGGARTAPRPPLPPPADAHRTSCDRAARARGPARPGRRVLIVEDDELTREMLTAILQGEGYLTETAAHGREALAHMETAPLPDLIVLDLLMPVMNGWEFCAAQAHDPRLASIPVVIVTATDSELTDTVPPLHAAAHLRKPITVEELLDAVGRC